ncbi:MAG TPA: glycosyltransferase family 4 protein [Casimicrobiaceae bacterium]|nr:glycosyltransferase family 4 protein [Casimicrobiaceae bacterium]
MKIAFYAPLKPPDHPVPSGDREIARHLMSALRLAGHDVALASHFRSFDATGNAARQARLHTIGTRLADRLIARYRDIDRPQLWFTYHLHHKAPDHLGPRVSRALRIPYVVAEASIAPSQRGGPWAFGFADAYAAIKSADLVVFVNPKDVREVRRARGNDAAWAMLPPFIDASRFAHGAMRSPGARDAPLRLVTVAMMRDGAKLSSYRLLAAALAQLRDVDFTLVVVGDGPARSDVHAAFAAISERVSFSGARPRAEIATLLATCDVFVWPAIDEAIGLALIEAQACGLPVVAGATPGVGSVVVDGVTGMLAPVGDVGAFAAALRRLAQDARLRRQMANQARAHILAHHDVGAAAKRLDALLREAVSASCSARAAPRPAPSRALP